MANRSKVKVKDRLGKQGTKAINIKNRCIIIGVIIGFIAGFAGTVMYWSYGILGYKVGSIFKYMLDQLVLRGLFWSLIGGLAGFAAGMLMDKLGLKKDHA